MVEYSHFFRGLGKGFKEGALDDREFAAVCGDAGVHRSIESIGHIEKASFVSANGRDDSVSESLSAIFCRQFSALSGADEALSHIAASPPDIMFIGPSAVSHREYKFDLCQRLRQSGYGGIMVLVTENVLEEGGTSDVTAAGFDNYLSSLDIIGAIEDTVNWAIVNRKRKNKYIVQFDDSPDAIFTVDADGRIYDINRGAIAGRAGLTPKKIVSKAINIREIESGGMFETLIHPLIRKENIGKTFNKTVDEGQAIYQVKAKIHNVVTIGLVATVVKTDITMTIYSRTMDILMNSITMLSHRDNYTAGHSSRVYYYSRMIAEQMDEGKNRKFLKNLYFAALLHDIGKIGVRDSILLKPESLSSEEFAELSSHPIKGYRMLRHYEFLNDTLDLVRFHHERPDGQGYPDKLKGGRIPLGASIIAVADGFDAMTSTRPYRNSLSYEKARSEIRKYSGSQYHKDVANTFLSIMRPSIVSEAKDMSKRPLAAVSEELLENLI